MRNPGMGFGRVLMSAAACVPLLGLALSGTAYGQPGANSAELKQFHAVLNGICEKCHNTTDWAGGFAFVTLDLRHPGRNPKVWETAITKLTGRLMPPAGQPQPSEAVVDHLINYLSTKLDAAPNDRGVGHVPLERLSRDEYAAS
ncbi:MAG: hypothetical protein ACRET2_14645, partial [Steroidobacteraceae bacterium]